jgi:multidrug efflux pump subunit AcrB
MPKQSVVAELTDQFKTILPEAQVSPVSLQQKLELTIDQERAMLYNVSNASIIQSLTNAIKPTFIEDFEGGDASIPIVINNSEPSSVYDLLSNTMVVNTMGQQISLKSLISLHSITDFKSIKAKNEGEYYPIDINTSNPNWALQQVEKVLSKKRDLVTFSFSGSYFENLALLKEMAVVLAISVGLLYFILAAQFESFLQPLFILAELPVAIAGGIIFLYIGNNTINIMSLIGIVIMSGLVINDSILKLDAINRLRKSGVPLMAAISQGGHKRLKPIIMISLTNIGALLPTLFSNDMGSQLQKPLSLALFGGLTAGLLVSLFFVPLLYFLSYKKRQHLQQNLATGIKIDEYV